MTTKQACQAGYENLKSVCSGSNTLACLCSADFVSRVQAVATNCPSIAFNVSLGCSLDLEDSLPFPYLKLDNVADVKYFAHFNIGTPPQSVYLQIDTGSNALVIGSKACVDAGHCSSDTSPFDALASVTANITSTTVSVDYTSGFIAGNLTNDTIGFSTVNLPATFLLATNESASMQSQLNRAAAGIAGFSRKSQIVPALFEIGSLLAPIFSLWLNGTGLNGGKSVLENGGRLVFGGTNPFHYKGPISYFVVSDVQHWSLPLTSMVATPTGSGVSSPQQIAIPSSAMAMFDSGNSLLSFPKAFIEQKLFPILFSRILNETGSLPSTTPQDQGLRDLGLYQIPCQLASLLPDISFSFGTGSSSFNTTSTFTLQWTDYVLPLQMATGRSQLQGSICALGLQATNGVANGTMDYWSFGDVFLRKYFSVYDFGLLSTARIGFALSNNSAPLFLEEISQAGLPTFGIAKTDGLRIPITTSASMAQSSVPSTTAKSGSLRVLSIFSVGLTFLISLVL
ncbi:aspartic peptidase domain-containing protein [Chytriomyces sp. MP71]|nr:aspartic peptidase domain-containing protein [Chytriomyces sp. MP71]